MEHSFYEEIHRAKRDAPYIDTEMTDIQYCAHYHEELEIVVLLDGVVRLTVDGQCTELHTGDIAVVRPFQIHSLETIEHSQLYILKILSTLFDFSAVERDRSVLSPQEVGYQEIADSIQQLIDEDRLSEELPLKRLALRTATDGLLLRLARLPGVRPVTQDSMLAHDRDIELLKTLNEYLAEHYQDVISLEDAAAVCHMSLYYFAHFFKRVTGTTFLSYLNGYRLEQVKHRVVESEDSFTTIAMQCGFPSIRTFNRCFQKLYKLTPTEARNRWRREGHIEEHMEE